MIRRLSVAALAAMIPAILSAAGSPEPASTRAAFEAMYPTTTTSAAALELERLAASIGIDLAWPEEKDKREHDHPTAEAAKAYEVVSTAVFEFLNRELKRADEGIGLPPPALTAFLEQNDPILESIRSVASGNREISWDVDVTLRQKAPLPYLAGQIKLQRLLIACALVQAHRGDPDSALQTLEASWRLSEALSARPEMVAHIVALAAERLQAGALRKIDSPAYGWTDRLRSRRTPDGFAAVVANEVWLNEPDIADLTGSDGSTGRAWARVAASLHGVDPCTWTKAGLGRIVEEAYRAEATDEDGVTLALPTTMGSLERVRRVMIDSELTALLLDARAERAASRRRAWPGRLTTLGAGVCPREAWTYRVSKNGTVTISFGGRSDETEVVGLRLPFTANAGVPAARARRPPRRPFARKAEAGRAVRPPASPL